MIRTTIAATIFLLCVSSSARSQQAAVPTPPKTVHPTPVSTTACRGCTDAATGKSAPVNGYDDKPAGTATKQASATTTVRHKKPKAKARTVERPAKKSKHRANRRVVTPKPTSKPDTTR